jgi:CYTH domain-containing protein
MALEIERKFLVLNTSFKKDASSEHGIKQGFLNSHKDRTVRVRISKHEGTLTIKGASSNDGLVRYEWERPLSLSDAEALIQLCEPGIIEKTRYLVPAGKHIFEVDVFSGDNEGLIVAELELKHAHDKFDAPNWLGKEVTGDIKYYNSQLAKNPFKNW